MLPLNEADCQFLLRLARRELEERILSRPRPVLGDIPPALQHPSGAFVTLRMAAGLRGCIGRVEAVAPLYRTVRECTVSAAVRDSRFDPVRPEEVAGLRIEISVLSSLQQVQPGDVEVGCHGLMVSQGGKRGLLLPQVAVEWNWDRIRFLEETCAKAGLPHSAWRHGACVHAFTAQIFAEQEPGGRRLAAPGLNQHYRV